MSRRKLHKPRRRPNREAGAVGVAAGQFARHAPDGVRVLVLSDYTRGDSAWVDGLQTDMQAAGMPRCQHLEERAGEGYVNAAEGYGRCVACHLEHAGVAGEAPSSCGRCGTLADSAGLRPIAVQLEPWVVCSVLCPVCAQQLAAEIRRSQRPAPMSVGA